MIIKRPLSMAPHNSYLFLILSVTFSDTMQYAQEAHASAYSTLIKNTEGGWRKNSSEDVYLAYAGQSLISALHMSLKALPEGPLNSWSEIRPDHCQVWPPNKQQQ